MHDKLCATLAKLESAQNERHVTCLAVWHELQAIDSDLAEEILALGFDEPTAAEWFCRSNSDGQSPAMCVATGRSADVRAALQRAAHGIVG